jgi:ribosomal protein S27AE
METRSEEKFFCAVDSTEPNHAEYGPFQTAEEAEEQARIFGWRWVVCYTHVLVFEKIVDVKTRYYEIEASPFEKLPEGRRKCPSCQDGTCTSHKPDTRLRQQPFDTSPVKPLSAAEAKEFAFLEQQMKEPPK